MNRGCGRSDPPSGLTGSVTVTAKPNRLSRSFRQSQPTPAATKADSPKNQQPEFKTPTRIPRPRATANFSGESPHNDSDFQQDIIWDATSPSPNRLGKRGRKKHASIVDISEIVSRIAPKHGRPEVTEPTLQQWIGDSATIPCTPDVQVPKPKKKSPKSNGVDDLLKLAKQFDFNMFRRDEEEAEELHQQSPELLSEDILDFENDFLPSLPGNGEPAVKAAAGTDVHVHPDQHMEDDLDFLFDGPTQHVSGNLSQMTSQVRPASGAPSKEASGKASATSHGPGSNTSGAVAHNDFEDDWENDDLLNDSLVLEMTQNLQYFTAPKLCSTQKPSSEIKYLREGSGSVPFRASVGLDQSAASIAVKENVRQRMTFRLESNSNFSAKRAETNTWTNWKVDYSSETAGKNSQQSSFPSCAAASVKAGSHQTWQTSNTVKSDPQKPQLPQRTSAKYNSTASTASVTSTAKPAQSFSSLVEAPAVCDLLDEDLDSIFSLDPVWDDPADDNLLCEVCEDVENQIQNAGNVSTKQTLPVSNHSAALKPSNRTWDNRNQPANQQPVPHKQSPASRPCASGRAAGTSSAAGFVSSVTTGVKMNTATNSFRFTQAKNLPGSSDSLARVQSSSRDPSAPQGNSIKEQFTFKKPNNPVCAVTSTVVGKCSAAEIELKKQQAMERRRQRLQAAQNLRAPT